MAVRVHGYTSRGLVMGRVDDEVKRRGRQALASLRQGAATSAGGRHAEAEVETAVTDEGERTPRSAGIRAPAARIR